MPGGIRVDLVALGRPDVIRWLQEFGTQRDGFVMGGLDVIDIQVEVHLLRRAIGPLRRNMVGRELNAQPPFAIDEDTVPIVVRFDRSTQQSGPEGALGSQVGGVEDDDLSGNPHAIILSTGRR